MSPRRPRVPRVDPALLPQPPAGAEAPRAPAASPASADAPAASPRPAPEAAAQPTVRPVETPPSSAAPASTAPVAARALRPATSSAPRPATPSTSPSTSPSTPRPAPRRAARPAPAPRERTAAGSGAARRRAPLPEPVPARQITGRSLLVVAALLAALVLVAPTLRVFLNQQLEISATEADIAERRAQRAQYEERLRLWDDPDYVAQQARDRLDLVMPGETLYTVTGLPDEAPAPADPAAPAPEAVNTRLPWVEGLWDSVIRSATE